MSASVWLPGVWDAVVLAGGRGRRMGGLDKPALVVGGRALLEVALDACAGARVTVVVGPRRPVRRPVIWAREDPPGSGPLAGLDAGLRRIPPGSGVVVVLAADLPAVTPAIVSTLVAAVVAEGTTDGAVAVDRTGRAQPLLAAYRRTALERALAAVGDPRDRPMKELAGRLALTPRAGAEATGDIDTPDDLTRWQEG